MKRKLHKLLSEGEGRQLLWLFIATLGTFLFFKLAITILFPNWEFAWQDIAALYLDAGCFEGAGEHDLLRLSIALVGVFVFSALLVSVFTNIFENVSAAYRKGEGRYSFNDHILILGGGTMLTDLLKGIANHGEWDGKDVLITTTTDVETLRDDTDAAIANTALSHRITYYHCDRITMRHLKEAHADKASVIYLIGEDNEPDHDAINIRCNQLLRQLCGTEGQPIVCYMVQDMHTSIEVANYLTKELGGSRLQTEIINASDYVAEQLLVNTDFLPAISADDTSSLHLVVIGSSRTSRAFASVAAHICHYPNFKRAGATTISFVDTDMRAAMNNFVANHQALFDLSNYRYVSEKLTEPHKPDERFGDFLDINWEFIDSHPADPFFRSLLDEWVNDEKQRIVVCVGYEEADRAVSTALHLPRAVYDAQTPVAIYLRNHQEIIEQAINSGRYGQLTCFGESSDGSDSLFLRRSLRGQRVNFIYDKAYGNPPSPTAEEAWRKLTNAHKLSSITSANALPLRLRSFAIEPTPTAIKNLTDSTMEQLAEVEHRRWMLSVLLMGYRAATKEARKDRSQFKRLKNEEFVHLDIAPWEELRGEEAKDMIIMENIPYIMDNGQPPATKW